MIEGKVRAGQDKEMGVGIKTPGAYPGGCSGCSSTPLSPRLLV